MRLCIVCGTRQAPKHRRLCRTCEGNKYMGRAYDKYKEQFAEDHTPTGCLMKDFLEYLDDAYGDQKREIAYRTRYTLEAITKGDIPVKDKWNLQDIVAIEEYRHNLSLQRKTALYHFVEFLKRRAEIGKDLEELKIIKVINEIPPEFTDDVTNYERYLHTYRKLKNWTRYQVAYSMKYFFEFISKEYHLNDIKQITREHIIGYINFLRRRNSQKNAYNRFREISSFFTWAQKHRIAFTNPCKNVHVNYGHQITEAIKEKQQRSLVNRWIDPKTDPREALIGVLALIYACSQKELINLTLDMLNNHTLTIPGRSFKIEFQGQLKELLDRYLIWREKMCKGAKNDYLFVSKSSYKLNHPMSQNNMYRIFQKNGVNLRELRSTRLQDIACTGDVKILEGLGLSFEGTRPYLRVAAPVLLMAHSTPERPPGKKEI